MHTRMQSAADLSPAYAAPPSLVPSTNRPFGHQSTYTKRLTVTRGTTMARLTNIDHDAAEWGRVRNGRLTSFPVPVHPLPTT